MKPKQIIDGLMYDGAKVLAALEQAGFRVVPIGRRCPWGKGMPDPGIEPETPCPVCGDLGTFDAMQTQESKCVE